MGEILTMNGVKTATKNTVEWKHIGYKKDGTTYPLKVWENLECILQKNRIIPRLNLINHEVTYFGLDGANLRNSQLTDIHSLQIREGLNLSREEVANSIMRIAEGNSYNPFTDMLESNRNSDYSIMKELFDCIIINPDFIENIEYYQTIFMKWCLNVVKMAHNTLSNDFSSQGVLVLQGGQGCFKSTFSRKLMPNKDWYKGDKSLDPDKVDSILQNTSYILVEWGELDSTLKAEQSKLKQFITATNDEYRTPYSRLPEKYPRVTSYIGTVNKRDFLKDETGSRRFWIIPVAKCDMEKVEKIDMCKFWGAVYDLWLEGEIEDYLTPEEQKILNEVNKVYSYENDITITLNEEINWNLAKDKWEVYNITEICNKLYIKDKKQLRLELEKKGIEYKNHRQNNGTQKKGFRLPVIY